MYPVSFVRYSSNCSASNQACVSPYMPLQIFINTYPQLMVLVVSVYCFMKSLSMSLSFRRMYSLRFMSILRQKSLISKVMYLDPDMDSMLFISSFTVMRATVGVLQSMGWCILSPPTVSLVMLELLLSYVTSHN